MPLAHNLGCPVSRNRKNTFLKNEKNSKNRQKAEKRPKKLVDKNDFGV